jgi:hypothetical protein
MRKSLIAGVAAGLAVVTLAAQPAAAQTDLPGLSSPAVVQFSGTVSNDAYAFARGTDGSLIVNRRLGGNWTGFSSLGGGIVGDPSAASVSSGALALVRGLDNNAYSTFVSAGSATGFSPIPGIQVGGRVTALERFGGVFIYARGLDGTAFTNELRNGGWVGWRSLGGVLTTDITAVTVGSDIYLFARGTDNAVYVNIGSSGNYGGWQRIGDLTVTSTIAAVTTGNPAQSGGRLVGIFARGSDNALYANALTGYQSSGWTSLGGAITSDPSGALVATGSPDVFVSVLGVDSALYVNRVRIGGAGQGFERLGGFLTGNPVAIQPPPVGGPDRYQPQVYARGTDNGLYVNTFSGGGWTGFAALGGQLS